MRILVIRHAKAGRREPWSYTDSARHLAPDGMRQAEELAIWLGTFKFTALFSSPFPRCLETLEPLRRQLSLEVKPDERLAEATTLVALESFLMGLEEEGVYAICSHGNVVPAIVELLVGRQVQTLPEPILSSKGSVWDIEIDRGTVRTVVFREPDQNRELRYR